MQRTVTRIASLDLARGLVVAIMALDHARIYFSEAGFDPTDLSQTTPAYFMTRWVTHLCAPSFFFIAGLGAGLHQQRTGSNSRTAAFLVSRGVWLMLLEVTLLGFFWSFQPGWWWFGVIWSLGAAFVLMAGLVYAPRWIVLGIGMGIIALGPVLSGVRPPEASAWAGAWALLHGGGPIDQPLVGVRLVLFPVLPWLAMMMAGYGATQLLFDQEGARPKRLVVGGALLLVLAAAVRVWGMNSLGWESVSVLAFLNMQKYPPALDFTLCMLGLLLVFLALLARFDRQETAPRALAPLAAYGGAPFLFYLAHILLIHAAALAVARVLGWDASYLFWDIPWPNLRPPEGFGFGLTGVYVVWLLVLAALYPVCRRFRDLKRRHQGFWLRYL